MSIEEHFVEKLLCVTRSVRGLVDALNRNNNVEFADAWLIYIDANENLTTAYGAILEDRNAAEFGVHKE